MTVESNPTNPETRALLERILAECPDCTRGESGGPRLCRRHLPEYSGRLFKALGGKPCKRCELLATTAEGAEARAAIDASLSSRELWHTCVLSPIGQHEQYLLETVPFTPEEVARVEALFEEERRQMSRRAEGAEIPLAQIRQAIAQERVEISRAARRRGTGSVTTTTCEYCGHRSDEGCMTCGQLVCPKCSRHQGEPEGCPDWK